MVSHPGAANLSEATADSAVKLDQHPLVNHRYTVVTPMIESTYALFRERVWLRHPGSYMYAQPRMGKTTCAEAIREFLREEFPDKLILRLDAEEYRGQEIVRALTGAAGLPPQGRTPIADIKDRFILFVRGELAVSGGNHLVLIVDEMQFLRDTSYKELLTIHNRLHTAGISMTTLGFAQPEINHQRSALLAIKSHHLVARFLCDPVKFDGCLSEEWLFSILRKYDESKRFPAGSAWTYTRFFLPQAFDSGFRLQSYAEPLWRQLHKACQRYDGGSVPMEHLTRTVEHLLLAQHANDRAGLTLSEAEIELSVRASNIYDFTDLMNQ